MPCTSKEIKTGSKKRFRNRSMTRLTQEKKKVFIYSLYIYLCACVRYLQKKNTGRLQNFRQFSTCEKLENLKKHVFYYLPKHFLCPVSMCVYVCIFYLIF